MAEGVQNRSLKYSAIPSWDEPHNNIAAPTIEANNFELNPSLLSAVQQNQFSGSPTEDLNLHLSVFLQYADTVKANGVSPEAIRLRLTIDAATGGALMDKPYNEAYQLIKSMAQNQYQWGRERTSVEKPPTKCGMYELSSLDHINAKVDALTQKIDNLTITPAATMAAVAPNCEI
ncbi:uncharacterized protein LOC127099416 [Lathyrus oleraceus]|uniref:uncharacterized protein LOC127099384 n=1 Tax=Pisum sativum TaxID=3888 RepID=UPI0021CEC626|nr:uncharacterized protein LOC127099384 [Pisum sativum]XP_050893345.1 uncharacterized protein LOC127099416 [Pisum sativum]